jgi:hypothetical protein
MSDILGVPAFGGGGALYKPTPDQPEPTVPAVAALASDSSATFNKGANLPSQNGETDTKKAQEQSGAYAPQDPRDAAEARAQFDPYILTGPTPSFQASVLEMESDLRNVIAQVEAKRALKSDEGAITPMSKSGEADARIVKTTEAEQSPTSRRDQRETPTSVELHETSSQPAPQFAAQQDVTQAQVQDREAAYAGQAATLTTPYNRPNGFD